MSKQFDVLSVGMIAADIPVRSVTPEVMNRDSTPVSSIGFNPGGDAQNVSITMTRLGAKVALCGMVGNDAFGRMVLDWTGSVGVDVSHVKVNPDCGTYISILLIDPQAERNGISYKEATDRFTDTDVDYDLLKQTKLLNFGSFFALRSFDGEPAARLLRAAKEQGVITSADTKTDRTGLGLKLIEPCLKHLDYFLPSISEVKRITGHSDPEIIADILLDLGVKNVGIKLGKDGCFVKNAQGSKYCPTFVVDAVDMTGCGDNFVSGFLTGVLRGKSLEECALFGNACGAINATMLGATGAVQSIEQVEAFIKTAQRGK